MPSTVKFRPDQPLFKADAFRMPLWIHAPFEVMRGITKWLTVTLARDNPHRDPMKNATFTRHATAPHRKAFWSGQPLVKGPKWKTAVRRWLTVWGLFAWMKYAPQVAWLWLWHRVEASLKWVGLDVLPFLWAHLWAVPLVVLLCALAIYAVVLGQREVRKVLREYMVRRHGGVKWYVYVLAVRDQVKGWLSR